MRPAQYDGDEEGTTGEEDEGDQFNGEDGGDQGGDEAEASLESE